MKGILLDDIKLELIINMMKARYYTIRELTELLECHGYKGTVFGFLMCLEAEHIPVFEEGINKNNFRYKILTDDDLQQWEKKRNAERLNLAEVSA